MSKINFYFSDEYLKEIGNELQDIEPNFNKLKNLRIFKKHILIDDEEWKDIDEIRKVMDSIDDLICNLCCILTDYYNEYWKDPRYYIYEKVK